MLEKPTIYANKFHGKIKLLKYSKNINKIEKINVMIILFFILSFLIKWYNNNVEQDINNEQISGTIEMVIGINQKNDFKSTIIEKHIQ